jgi:hypothetical protein
MASFCFAQPALAMGGPAPSKEKPKYKLEILKVELVGQPSTAEVALPKKSKLKK